MTSKHRTPLLVTTKTPSLLLVGAPDPSRDALAHLLTEAGYSLTTADSSEDAFHKVQSAPPDLLLFSAAAGSGSVHRANTFHPTPRPGLPAVGPPRHDTTG